MSAHLPKDPSKAVNSVVLNGEEVVERGGTHRMCVCVCISMCIIGLVSPELLLLLSSEEEKGRRQKLITAGRHRLMTSERLAFL